MKSLNFAFILTVLFVLITFAVVSVIGIHHVNETAQLHRIYFRNTSNDGKIIFLAITFFGSLFLTSIIGEIFYTKHLNNKRK